MTWFPWLLQILILSVGVYVFLRFVQTTRGSRLVRGLIVSTIVIAVGLFGLTRWLELEELGHILQSVAGFLVILLAVLFQPELRRGIAELGEGTFVGRMIRTLSRDSINEIVQAVQSMASRRTGALIAIECESSLDAYVEGGVKVDASVHRLLLESIFHHGSALHDGAVVIRKDRVAAAACLFPLTENIRIARSTGTRHRAALGLTDEADAVTIVVSEETGRVSVARHGQLEGVPPNRLDQVLRKALGGDESSEAANASTRSAWATWPRAIWAFLREDWVWLASSLVLGSGIFYTANRELADTEHFSLRVVTATAGERRSAGTKPGELLVLLPSEEHRATSIQSGVFVRVRAEGTRAQIGKLGQQLSGLVELVKVNEGSNELPLDEVRWREDVFGVDYEWADPEPPSLEVVRFARKRFVLGPSTLTIDGDERDMHYTVHAEGIAFDPPAVEVEGPAAVVNELGQTTPLRFQPIVLEPGQDRDWNGPVVLSQLLRDQRLALTEAVTVTVPLRPERRDLGSVTREVPLVCTRVERVDELERWSVPSHARSARFSIHVSGLIPAEAAPDSPVFRQRSNAIQRFVEENLVVYADVAELPPAGQGRGVRVRFDLREDWRSSLAYLVGSLGQAEDLWVELESEAEILLEERKPTGSTPATTPADEGT